MSRRQILHKFGVFEKMGERRKLTGADFDDEDSTIGSADVIFFHYIAVIMVFLSAISPEST